MDKNLFKSTILTHTGGFLLSTGDQNAECDSPVEFCSQFFDSAMPMGENYLNFQNKLDKKVVGEKTFSSIYSLGSASVYLKRLKSVKEFDGSYLVDQFLVNVQRMFSLELEDRNGNSSWVALV